MVQGGAAIEPMPPEWAKGSWKLGASACDQSMGDALSPAFVGQAKQCDRDFFTSGSTTDTLLQAQQCNRDFFTSCSTTDTLPQVDGLPHCTTFDTLPRMDTPPPSMMPKSALQAAVEAAIRSCKLPVTVAEPASQGGVLMVSTGFEALTGAPKETLLASSLRCLDTDPVWQDPLDLMRLRAASKTGEQTSAVLLKRKLSGECLKVLVHLRGLSVGKDSVTGEELWFLIGMYINVDDTEADASEVLQNNAASIAHLEEQVQKAVSDHMEAALVDQLWTTMPSAASSEPMLLVLPECCWMQSSGVE